MHPWLQYTRERFPLLTYTLIAGGLALSPMVLAEASRPFSDILIGFGMLLVFFFTLRLMDERKDYETDVVAHPDRPLPRGLLSVKKVERLIGWLVMGMMAFSGVLVFVSEWQAGLCFAVTTLWLWLMYREFYIGDYLEARPLLYALTHQIIILPLVFSMAYLGTAAATEPVAILQLAVLILTGFFSYEVGRKLDPHAHQLLHTYLKVYGRNLTVLILVALQILGLWMAYELGIILWMAPLVGLVLLSTIFIYLWPHRFKVVESIVSLYLLATIWVVGVLILL